MRAVISDATPAFHFVLHSAVCFRAPAGDGADCVFSTVRKTLHFKYRTGTLNR